MESITPMMAAILPADAWMPSMVRSTWATTLPPSCATVVAVATICCASCAACADCITRLVMCSSAAAVSVSMPRGRTTGEIGRSRQRAYRSTLARARAARSGSG